MTSFSAGSSWRVLLPVALGTGLSLFGDTSLYTVLPTHVTEAGVSVASVGILLSANRFIRLLLNSPIGLVYDRWPRRYLFVPALFIGASSTAIYGLTQGFWPLLIGRLLWGLAWVGIWIGGNTIILDITNEANRGWWVGVYQAAFFLGAFTGSVFGGFLTDWLDYHQAMQVGASWTLLGAIIALLFLPETRDLRKITSKLESQRPLQGIASKSTRAPELASATVLFGLNRLLGAGFLLSTFGLFLFEQMGTSIRLANLTLGVATVTGIGLGLNALISMLAGPVAGRFSDRIGNRWHVVAGGLTPGVVGYGLLSIGSPLAIFFGIPLTAFSGGSNQSLSTAIIGDLSGKQQQGRQLGILYTAGDLASAVGPPLAYALIPVFGLSGIYLLSTGLSAVMLLVAVRWGAKFKPKLSVAKE